MEYHQKQHNRNHSMDIWIKLKNESITESSLTLNKLTLSKHLFHLFTYQPIVTFFLASFEILLATLTFCLN